MRLKINTTAQLTHLSCEFRMPKEHLPLASRSNVKLHANELVHARSRLWHLSIVWLRDTRRVEIRLPLFGRSRTLGPNQASHVRVFAEPQLSASFR